MTNLTEELVAMCRLFAAFEKEQVCGGEVTVAQCVVLQSLLKGSSEAALLAEENGVSRSAMTRLIDGLERKSWIERTRDPDDRRHVAISLTRSGTKEARRLRDLTTKMIDTVLGELPKAKRAQVTESITLVREVLARCRREMNC